VLLLADNGATPSSGSGALCVRFAVASAKAPPRVKWVPSYCVSAAGLALIAEMKSCGAATLVPAIPPDAGISVLRKSIP
jgi:hypothetical protein